MHVEFINKKVLFFMMKLKHIYKYLIEIDEILKELKKEIGYESIKKIIKSYNKGNVKEYFRLLKEYNTKGQISEKDFNRFDLYRWERGMLPDQLRTLKRIYGYKFHKIDKKILARIIGWGFGDGGINKDNPRYYFFCGKKEDLIEIKGYLKKNIKKIKIFIEDNNIGTNTIKTNGIIRTFNSNKKTYTLYVRNSAFVRFLYGIGLPKGEKVLQEIKIPSWIINGTREIKLEFLEGILESENQKHNIRFNKEKNKIEIPVISFGMCKEINHKKNLIMFLDSLKNMLQEFNIRCGKIENPKLSNIRKRDKKITCFSRFSIYTSALDVINFSKMIKYRFNKEKRLHLNLVVEEAKRKLIRFHEQKLKFKEAIDLFNNNTNIVQIAKKLNVATETIKQWTTKKEHLPRYLDIDLRGIING